MTALRALKGVVSTIDADGELKDVRLGRPSFSSLGFWSESCDDDPSSFLLPLQFWHARLFDFARLQGRQAHIYA
jgi:hypothetical protein